MLTKLILSLSAIASIGSIAIINLHQPDRAIATSTKIGRASRIWVVGKQNTRKWYVALIFVFHMS